MTLNYIKTNEITDFSVYIKNLLIGGYYSIKLELRTTQKMSTLGYISRINTWLRDTQADEYHT